MTLDFATLLPEIKPWLKGLATVWPVPLIKTSSWAFPVLLCSHVVALTMLGGAILLPSLRLMGVGMTRESSAVIERTMRPWLVVALVILVVTGVLMGMVNPMKLYIRPAFFVKMIALVAALILSFGVVRSIAVRDGVVTMQAKILAAVALAGWLTAVVIFGTSFGAAPGMFHVICVGWLIVMAFGSHITRLILGGITAVAVVVIGVITYVIYTPLDNYDIVMEINRWTLRCAAVVVAGFILWEFTRQRATETPSTPFNRLVGVFSILAWFTIAAAGRWIGLGTS
ncbi:MAG: DUF6644 family protein [Alphaproteobacteria bacterium]